MSSRVSSGLSWIAISMTSASKGCGERNAIPAPDLWQAARRRFHRIAQKRNAGASFDAARAVACLSGREKGERLAFELPELARDFRRTLSHLLAEVMLRLENRRECGRLRPLGRAGLIVKHPVGDLLAGIDVPCGDFLEAVGAGD